MKIFGMGGLELVIILVVILLIFGPKNLPKLGSALGKTVSNLREGMGAGKKKKAKEEAAQAAEKKESEAKAAAPEIEGVITETIAEDEGDSASTAEPVKKVCRVRKVVKDPNTGEASETIEEIVEETTE